MKITGERREICKLSENKYVGGDFHRPEKMQGGSEGDGDSQQETVQRKYRPIQQGGFSELSHCILEYRWSLKQSSTKNVTHILLNGDYGGTLSVPDAQHEEFMRAYIQDIQAGVRHFVREEKTAVFPLAVDLDHDIEKMADKWTSEQIHMWAHVFHAVLKKCYPVGDRAATTADRERQTETTTDREAPTETERQTKRPTDREDPTETEAPNPKHDPFLCIITFRPAEYSYTQKETNHAQLERKHLKEGFRLSFPNLMVSCETAQMIRQCVLREWIGDGAKCRMLFRLAEGEPIGEAIYHELEKMLDASVYVKNGFRLVGSAKTVASRCGRKKNNCSTCYNNSKFDIGLVYKLFRCMSSVDITHDQERSLYRHFSDFGNLVRACSVRKIPAVVERAGFVCPYDLSGFFLATRQGAQCISADEKRVIAKTQRMFDRAEDRPKYEAFLHYLQTADCPPPFPFSRMQLEDIKSIHLRMSARNEMFYIILIHSYFCAIKKAEHSGFKAYFVLGKDGLKQKCQSETCGKLAPYRMPPLPEDVFRVFFPTDNMNQFCGIPDRVPARAELPTPELTSPRSTVDVGAIDTEAAAQELTTEQIISNAGQYFPSSASQSSIQKQIQTWRQIVHLLKTDLQAFDKHCRNGTTSRAQSRKELLDEYNREQGVSNSMFGGRGGRGASGGNRGRGGGRRRPRENDDGDQERSGGGGGSSYDEFSR